VRDGCKEGLELKGGYVVMKGLRGWDERDRMCCKWGNLRRDGE